MKAVLHLVMKYFPSTDRLLQLLSSETSDQGFTAGQTSTELFTTHTKSNSGPSYSSTGFWFFGFFIVLCFKLKSLAQSMTASLYINGHLESKFCKINNQQQAYSTSESTILDGPATFPSPGSFFPSVAPACA